MQSDEGILQSFMDKQVPEGWTAFNVGQIVKIEDCYFKVVVVDVNMQLISISPMPKREAVEEILKKTKEQFKHFCNDIHNGRPEPNY